MFHLLVLMFCLPFYIMYWFLKILVYTITVIVSFVNVMIEKRKIKVKNEYYVQQDIATNKFSANPTYNQIKNNNLEESITGQKIDTAKQDIKNNVSIDLPCKPIDEIYPKQIEKYEIVMPSDLEYKIAVDKIQELYKELGFCVKVIDIKKNKYNTIYKIIFSREIKQYEILSVSEKIMKEFDSDGITIKGTINRANGIDIVIPLEYKKTIKALT